MAYSREQVAHNNHVLMKYRQGTQRFATFKAALTIASQRIADNYMVIVETGCQREADDWGAGMSTRLWAEWVAAYGGEVWTIDNSAEHLERCRKHLAPLLLDNVETLCMDSVEAFQPSLGRADLLYLDSFDYPYGKLLEIYGGKTDIAKAQAILAEMPEAEIVEKYGYIIDPCQQHCLAEVKAARESGVLGDRTVLLIDDNSIPGGGKARLANQWLAANGWECVLEDYQALWVRR